jgi:hypothetical protein
VSGGSVSIFRKSNFRWDCDQCGVPFRAGKGGVCPTCKRALCDAHLHGSLLLKVRRSLLHEPTICVWCREKLAAS